MQGNFSGFCGGLLIFFKNNFFKKIFQEHYQSVKCFLNSDQDQHSVGPDMGPNCLQRLSTDIKSRR